MTTTLTLKNIPDALYDRLKLTAQQNRRSLNSEAIVCLEAVLLPMRLTSDEHLASARAFRASLPSTINFSADDFDAAKREGRP